MPHLFTSESVAAGHPDKVCDRISDEILDLHLVEDPNSRVACETLATDGLVVVAGEISSEADHTDQGLAEVIREVVGEVGYEQEGFHPDTIEVNIRLNQQSPDIAQGVDRDGAGDQGIMFGYAVDQTPELMPLPIHLAHSLVRNFEGTRNDHDDRPTPFFGPDMKAQVTVEYDGKNPTKVTDVLISAQHLDEDASADEVRQRLMPTIEKALGDWWNEDIHILTNPTGKFHIGGPVGDCGLTGRKIIVDTYGGAAPHGGGAFSGKDPTKVDRSAAYMARYLAKNIVANGEAKECLIQLAYAIGVADPISFLVIADGEPNEALANRIKELVDLRPKGIITHLDLKRPIYATTSSGGHFGRLPFAGTFPWEQVNLEL